ncbi:hypothetical protein [Dongia deserti]|uniref:hypothetical protein n=1 Tax=Dongia deserti TaxID=2268030 RepID=UPI000E65AA81|nr:hypothetical protein [Dongia deserti]
MTEAQGQKTQIKNARGAGARGTICTMRLPAGGVRVEVLTALDRVVFDLPPDEAKRHALGILKHLEPLSDTGAAAIAVERAEAGGGNG